MNIFIMNTSRPVRKQNIAPYRQLALRFIYHTVFYLASFVCIRPCLCTARMFWDIFNCCLYALHCCCFCGNCCEYVRFPCAQRSCEGYIWMQFNEPASQPSCSHLNAIWTFTFIVACFITLRFVYKCTICSVDSFVLCALSIYLFHSIRNWSCVLRA